MTSSSKDYKISTPKATYYYAKKGGVTASGKKVIPEKVKSGYHRWIAISRDLRYQYNFGDTVIIKSIDCPNLNGEWIVQDLMPAKWKNKIDFLVHKDNIEEMRFYNPHEVKMRKKK